MYEDDIMTKVPSPKINADFDASFHMTKSTAKLHPKHNLIFAQISRALIKKNIWLYY